MELVRKRLVLDRQKTRAVSYVTLEEAFNLNETLEDIDSVIQEKGETKILEVRAEQNQVKLLGEVDFSFLYSSATLEKHLVGYAGRMSFEEVLNMEGITAEDDLNVKAQIDELRVEVVNSRKVSVHAILCLQAVADEYQEEEIVTDVEDETGAIQIKKGELTILSCVLHRKESFRVKEELEIPSNQANIGKLIWYCVSPVNLDVRLQEGQVSIFGDLQVFALYQAEEEEKNETVQEVIPFHQAIPCEECHEQQLLRSSVEQVGAQMEVSQDYDGEERGLHITASFDMDLHLYQEERVELLEDVYSVREEVTGVTSLMTYQKLLSQNSSKCRVNEMMHMKNASLGMLQLLNSQGQIKIEEVTQTEGGVLVDGTLEVKTLYVTSDDEHPFASHSGSVPIHHLVEIPKMSLQSEFQTNCYLEQLSVAMGPGGELEVKALVAVQVFAYDMALCPVIKDLEVTSQNLERLHLIPGITGYFVKEGDCLWEIAKAYSTTVTDVMETNGLKNDQIKEGDALVIVKAVGESLA